jgi:cellulose synthase/poly-beta-1,6-N-acetylglucosamine synthase-like glycosyltransferase
MPGERSITILIPCYNEEVNLRAGALDNVLAYARASSVVLDVLVVDDGSSDGSVGIVSALASSEPMLRVLREPHRGKAGALIAGSRAARGEWVLFCDMDQATPVLELDRLLPEMDQGSDVVIGSRATHREGAPLVRQLMARGYIQARRLILDLGAVTDTQCGFKAYRRDVLNEACDRLVVFGPAAVTVRGAAVTAAFDAELLFLARRLGYRIAEVPVRWRHVGTRRVHPVRESWRGLKGLLQIRLADLRGGYPRPSPGRAEVPR